MARRRLRQGFRAVRENRYLFWSLVLAVVVLLNLPPPAVLRTSSEFRDGLAPFQNTLSLVISRVGSLLSRIGRTGRLLQEKQDLEFKIAGLEHHLRRLEYIGIENEELRRQLGFSILSPQKLLLCEVTARGDMSGWWQTVRLNKGLASGISSGMAVMTTDGLIGRTIEVSERTSDVLMITDPNCKVACKTARSGAFGIMRGAGVRLSGKPAMEMLASVNPAILNYISTVHEIQEGDVVLTSGLGGVFPEGLPVGRIGRVRPHESGLYLQADVIPSAKMNSFRYAFVILEQRE
jgi:rod shape-determining protein MreC